VNASCRDFRMLLENRLARRATRPARRATRPAQNAAPERLADLAWHEHLFTCEGCRALLDAEQALESLLASLPEPYLEPAVRDRVLARLRHARDEERLDSLLDLAGAAQAPSGLARSVLVSVTRREGDEQLDRLLDLDVVTVPEGLTERTLTALHLAPRFELTEPRLERRFELTEPRLERRVELTARRLERRSELTARRLARRVELTALHLARRVELTALHLARRSELTARRLARRSELTARRLARRSELTARRLARRSEKMRPLTRRIAGFAAAAAVLAAIAWIVRGLETQRDVAPPAIVDVQPSRTERPEVGAPNAPVSDEMLAALDVLENWDVLITEDVETLLSTLPADAAVLLEDLEDEG